MIFKSRKKAFSIIELLAVIVVLAIIFLIVMPAILNITSDVRRGSREAMALGLVKTAERAYLRGAVHGEKGRIIVYIFENGQQIGENKLDFSGKPPDNGRIIVWYDGRVSVGLEDDGWCLQKDFDSDDITVTRLEDMDMPCEIPDYLGEINWSLDAEQQLVAEAPLFGGNVQYSIDQENWQNTNIFVGLTPGEEYTFYVYVEETFEAIIAIEVAPMIYTITYTSGAGGEVEPSEYVMLENGTSIIPNVTTNEGFEFSHFSTTSGMGRGMVNAQNGQVSNVTGDMTVRANFMVLTYTVTYSSSVGGEVFPPNRTVTHGSNAPAPIINTDTGYSFVDFETIINPGNGTLNTDTGEVANITGNLTVRANFEINQYTVTYQAGSGGSINPNSEQVDWSSANNAPNANPDTGYTLNNYVITSGTCHGDFDASDGICDDVRENITIRANFLINQYTVTYAESLGCSLSPLYRTVNHGGDSIPPTLTLATGYTFSHYSVTSGVENGNLESASGLVTDVTGNMTVQANVVLNQYTITYTVTSGGTITPDSMTVDHGADVPAPSITTNAGYSFGNFSIISGGGNAGIDPNTGALTEVIGDVTVRANFSINQITVSYTSSSGGSVSPTSEQINWGSSNNGTALSANAGYSFNNFIITSGSCHGTFNSNTGICNNIRENITIRANFSINTYTVSYNGNGGSCSPTSRTVSHGASAAGPTCTRSGYTDTSYSITNGSCHGTFNPSDGSCSDVRQNMTIRANWTINAPATPSGLSCNTISTSRIDLSWNSVSSATGYYVYRCTGTSCSPTSHVATRSSTSWANTGLSEGTTYRYRVRAYNAGGTSGYSTISSCSTPLNSCGNPSYRNATSLTGGTTGYVRYDNSSNCSNYTTQRRYYNSSTGSYTSWSGTTTSFNQYSGYYRVSFSISSNTSYTHVQFRSRATDSSRTNSSYVTGPLELIDHPVQQHTVTYNGNGGSCTPSTRTVDHGDSAAGPTCTRSGYTDTSYSITNGSCHGNFDPSDGSCSDVRQNITIRANWTIDAPATPSGLSCNTISTSRIDLSWNSVSSATGYYVYRCTGTSCSPTSHVATRSSTSWANTGLSEGTTYRYRVRAYNAGGTSGYSVIRSCTTQSAPCSAPSYRNATSLTGGTTGYVRYDNSSNCSNYTTQRRYYNSSTGSYTSWSGTTTSFDQYSGYYRVSFSISSNTSYTHVQFRSRATDSSRTNSSYVTGPLESINHPPQQHTVTYNGNGGSCTPSSRTVNHGDSAAGPTCSRSGHTVSSYQVTSGRCASGFNPDTGYCGRVEESMTIRANWTINAPATPSGLSCNTISTSRIDLSWNSVSNATGYYVYRCTGTSCSPTSHVATRSSTSWANTGLNSGTTYRYRVRAYNAGGTSGYSVIRSCTTQAATCGAPSYYYADGLTGGTTGYVRFYNSSNCSNYMTQGRAYNSSTGSWTSWGQTTTNFTQYGSYYRVSFDIPSGSHYTHVQFRSRATDSSMTNSSYVTGPSEPVSHPVQQHTVTYNANGGSCNPSSRTVNHGDNAAGPSCSRSGYNISSFTITSGSCAGTFYTSTGRCSNVQRNMTIRANWTSSAPATPSGFSCNATSSSRIFLSWNSVSGATGYYVYRCTGTSCTPNTRVATRSTTSWANTGLSAGTTYRYRVRAYNASGTSSYSVIRTCTTDSNFACYEEQAMWKGLITHFTWTNPSYTDRYNFVNRFGNSIGTSGCPSASNWSWHLWHTGSVARDNTSGLLWTYVIDCWQNWERAKNTCDHLNSYSAYGRSNWRLPTKNELMQAAPTNHSHPYSGGNGMYNWNSSFTMGSIGHSSFKRFWTINPVTPYYADQSPNRSWMVELSTGGAHDVTHVSHFSYDCTRCVSGP